MSRLVSTQLNIVLILDHLPTPIIKITQIIINHLLDFIKERFPLIAKNPSWAVGSNAPIFDILN